MSDKRTLEDLLETARFQRSEQLRIETEKQTADAEAELRKIEEDQSAALECAYRKLPEALWSLLGIPEDCNWIVVSNWAKRLILRIPGCVEISVMIVMEYDKGNFTKPLGYSLSGFKVQSSIVDLG